MILHPVKYLVQCDLCLAKKSFRASPARDRYPEVWGVSIGHLEKHGWTFVNDEVRGPSCREHKPKVVAAISGSLGAIGVIHSRES
jgi:hypothetical protein